MPVSTPAFDLPAGRSALLLMDFQTAVVEMLGEDDGVLKRTASLAAAARKAGIPVIHVCIGFREGFIDVHPRNKSFGAIKESGRFAPGSPGTEIHKALAPQPGDLQVTKRRVSAFAGSDLEFLLRAQGIDTLLLTGLATSGVVLSTLRQAADLDYRLGVVADCCGDRDAEVHRVLIEKVFPRQAEVMDCAGALSLLKA